MNARVAALLLAACVLLMAAPAAGARTPIRVGVSDQQTSMFAQDAFQRAKFKRVRYFIAWNAMDNPGQRLAVDLGQQPHRLHGAAHRRARRRLERLQQVVDAGEPRLHVGVRQPHRGRRGLSRHGPLRRWGSGWW